jgi:hypothetical protein
MLYTLVTGKKQALKEGKIMKHWAMAAENK